MKAEATERYLAQYKGTLYIFFRDDEILVYFKVLLLLLHTNCGICIVLPELKNLCQSEVEYSNHE